MKLPKVSMRLILRSAIVAIVIVQVLLWVWYVFERRLVIPLYYLPILVFGCLLFFVRDIYIHGVTKKYPRLTVAARVLGALGASAAFSLFLLFAPYPIPVGLFMSLMAIAGVKLALARPKVAGVLMLLAGIMPLIVSLRLRFLFDVWFLFDVLGLEWEPHVVMLVGLSIFVTFGASLLLIPGGITALLSARRKQPGNRVIVAFIVIIPLMVIIAYVTYIYLSTT